MAMPHKGPGSGDGHQGLMWFAAIGKAKQKRHPQVPFLSLQRIAYFAALTMYCTAALIWSSVAVAAVPRGGIAPLPLSTL